VAEQLSRYRNSDSEAEPPQAVDAEAHSRAVAEYLGDMIGQLESMARVQGLDLLVYLLSMARVEAETTARDKGSRRRSSV
jgi:hypothetical protein